MKAFKKFDDWQNFREGGTPKPLLRLAFACIFFLWMLSYCSCAAPRDIQVRAETVKVIKIDTAFRIGGNQRWVLLKTPRGERFSAYCDFTFPWILGATFIVLIQK